MSISNSTRRPAVFLDRDGTIIEDQGHLSRPSQVAFFAGTVSALRRLNEHFALFIVTNQSGVAKGLLTLEDVGRVNGHVVSYLAGFGIRIIDTYVCPHDASDGCECIKPKPYFLRKAEKEHGIDLSRSFAVGDHPHDVAFAENAGARGIYVLSGHGIKHRHELWEDARIAAGIEQAADIICEIAAAATAGSNDGP
ncbi:MAG: HAD family hydrolase [Desulfosalsimonadaceae bacterium]